MGYKRQRGRGAEGQRGKTYCNFSPVTERSRTPPGKQATHAQRLVEKCCSLAPPLFNKETELRVQRQTNYDCNCDIIRSIFNNQYIL